MRGAECTSGLVKSKNSNHNQRRSETSHSIQRLSKIVDSQQNDQKSLLESTFEGAENVDIDQLFELFSNSNSNFDSNSCKKGCHRYDQSLENLLIGNYYHWDSRNYISRYDGFASDEGEKRRAELFQIARMNDNESAARQKELERELLGRE